MKQACILVLYYLIGIMVAGFVVVPCFYNITSNTRVFDSSFMFRFPEPQTYLSIISSFFIPTSITANRGFDLSSVFQYITPAKTDLKLFLWSGSITTLLVV